LVADRLSLEITFRDCKEIENGKGDIAQQCPLFHVWPETGTKLGRVTRASLFSVPCSCPDAERHENGREWLIPVQAGWVTGERDRVPILFVGRECLEVEIASTSTWSISATI
jgi:hypothetical protein